MNYSKSGNLICKGLYIGEEDLQKINTLTRREIFSRRTVLLSGPVM